jgi:hypothetical protein
VRSVLALCRTNPRGLTAGAALALLYLGAILGLGARSPRLLYDGTVPMPPYQWVHPPNGAAGAAPPSSAAGTLTLGAGGSAANEVSTDDLQASVTFPEGAVAPHAGDSSVKVTITPVDAATVARAPAGHRFDSNGYRIEAVYTASGAPATLVKPVDVALTYAVHATIVLRAEDKSWTILPGTVFPASQQIVAHSDRLGTFAASP